MDKIRAICVFCASSQAVDDAFKNTALELGRELGDKGIDLVYGGASIGLMGCVARGVHEKKGRVIGVLPEFFKTKDIEYSEADELIVTQDMRERKAVMDRRSDAFIVLPGGIGTYEEAIEILSMRQLRQTDKPLVFINTQGFYEGLHANFMRMVELKFAKPEILDMYAMVPDPQSALDYLFSYVSTPATRREAD
ncbi:MAG: TIGR00730 family Rossman fold protein [Nitrospina sp.]|nr:TIGR00730 family Rossman fold protein [Nitrospina sp.]MBT6717011.1 TIGR00730 family Rossman fold protein [Nitrospina sp.]